MTKQCVSSITVSYFARLRELAGRSEEGVELETGDTPARIYPRLAQRHAFPLQLRDLRVAINDAFVDFDTPLSPGDRLVFITPVAGG